MTQLYLLPKSGNAEEVAEVANRNKIPMVTVEKLRDLVLIPTSTAEVLCFIEDKQLYALIRNGIDEILESMPTVLTAAPDIAYMGAWATAATALPSMMWKEFEKSHRKSGTVHNTLDDLSRAQVSTIPGEGTVDDDPIGE